MATTKFYLDTRAVKSGEPAPLKICLTKNGRAAYIPLNIRILPSQWDKAKCRVKEHTSKTSINSYINTQKQKIDTLLLQLSAEGKLAHLTSTQIKNLIVESIAPKTDNTNLLLARLKLYAGRCKKTRTSQLYEATYKRIIQFDKCASSLSFEQITKDWLIRFDAFLTKTEPSANSRSIHFRNLRAVFNDAIDNDITNHYPFRKFMVRPVETTKRAYSVERLRELFNYPVLPHEQKYLDAFKLIFYLIGINLADLYALTEIKNGRIEYKRAKTGRLYNVKVEPEALEIIEKYKGKNTLLNFADHFTSVHSYMCTLNRALQHIGKREHAIVNGKRTLVYKPEFPDLSSYVARHTWATIAAELDIPNETIAAALGHSFGNRTTAIYIKNDTKKVDDANRRVIDYVLEKVNS